MVERRGASESQVRRSATIFNQALFGVNGSQNASVVERLVLSLASGDEKVMGKTPSCALMVGHGTWIGLLVQGMLEGEAIRAALGVTFGWCLY
jgi:hypothetical protein